MKSARQYCLEEVNSKRNEVEIKHLNKRNDMN